jgi:threonyl-tRNA synthetase
MIYIDGKGITMGKDRKTVKELALLINNIDINKIVAIKINGVAKDLNSTLKDGDSVEYILESNVEALDILRHSTSHLMAQAVKHLYKDAKLAIGPSIENGFYYDIDLDVTLSEEDLLTIEKEMQKISKWNYPIIRKDIQKNDAIKLFENLNEPYKLEILKDINESTVSIYEQGDFVDLCTGPHLPSTGRIKHFKLTSLAGAYWRGDSKNKMLQRIYGTAFFTKDALDEYLKRIEEAQKRDHRKLGRQLGLFIISDEIGAGLPIYLPKGGMLRSILEAFEKQEHIKRGYSIVYGPTILKKELWGKSGHLDNYKENMYFTKIDDTEYGIKPMNCINHIMIYKSEIRSYRDLPLRFFELGTVHRHEKSGVLHGLLRVRAFTQDDAHIFCTDKQLVDEIHNILEFVKDIMAIFGFIYHLSVSTRPEKYMGSTEIWKLSTEALINALDTKGLKYEINEGDGAFYGPKIDITLTDALGRQWQCATIQCDFNLPERFDLTYVGEDGLSHRPVMLHRVILGSIDRFIGILIEHFAGLMPFWLAPIQISALPIADRHFSYADEIINKLKCCGFRCEVDKRNEKIGYKIRQATSQKIPHALIIGDNEMNNKTISVRLNNGTQYNNIDIEQYIAQIKDLNDNKSIKYWR